MIKCLILQLSTDVYSEVNRMLLIMKIIIALLLIGTIQLNATTFSQTITLNVKDVSLKQVFDAVHQQTRFGVIYSDEHVNKKHKITISAHQMPLGEFLEEVLAGQKMSFRIKEQT